MVPPVKAGRNARASKARAGGKTASADGAPTGAGAAGTDVGPGLLGRARGAAADAGRSAGEYGRGAADRTGGPGTGAPRTVGRLGGSSGPRSAADPVAGPSVKVPLASASLRLPGPGAVVQLGPVQVTLPTGALYYGGLVALVVGGTLELPVAAGAAVAGAVLGRRWLRSTTPTVTAFDSAFGNGPEHPNQAP